MTTQQVELPVEVAADLAALQALAVKHRRDYLRIRTAKLAELTGQPVRFTRDRMTPEQLAALPPVVDSTGVELTTGMRVRCPDGVRAVIERVDKRSRRCVVDRSDGAKKMTVATKLTALNVRRAQHAA